MYLHFMWLQKCILPIISDLKFSTINFDETCDYLKEENGCDHISKKYILQISDFTVRK